MINTCAATRVLMLNTCAATRVLRTASLLMPICRSLSVYSTNPYDSSLDLVYGYTPDSETPVLEGVPRPPETKVISLEENAQLIKPLDMTKVDILETGFMGNSDLVLIRTGGGPHKAEIKHNTFEVLLVADIHPIAMTEEMLLERFKALAITAPPSLCLSHIHNSLLDGALKSNYDLSPPQDIITKYARSNSISQFWTVLDYSELVPWVPSSSTYSQRMLAKRLMFELMPQPAVMLIWASFGAIPSTGGVPCDMGAVMNVVWEMPAADRELLPELPVTSRGINELGALQKLYSRELELGENSASDRGRGSPLKRLVDRILIGRPEPAPTEPVPNLTRQTGVVFEVPDSVEQAMEDACKNDDQQEQEHKTKVTTQHDNEENKEVHPREGILNPPKREARAATDTATMLLLRESKRNNSALRACW